MTWEPRLDLVPRWMGALELQDKRGAAPFRLPNPWANHLGVQGSILKQKLAELHRSTHRGQAPVCGATQTSEAASTYPGEAPCQAQPSTVAEKKTKRMVQERCNVRSRPVLAPYSVRYLARFEETWQVPRTSAAPTTEITWWYRSVSPPSSIVLAPEWSSTGGIDQPLRGNEQPAVGGQQDTLRKGTLAKMGAMFHDGHDSQAC